MPGEARVSCTSLGQMVMMSCNVSHSMSPCHNMDIFWWGCLRKSYPSLRNTCLSKTFPKTKEMEGPFAVLLGCTETKMSQQIQRQYRKTVNNEMQGTWRYRSPNALMKVFPKKMLFLAVKYLFTSHQYGNPHQLMLSNQASSTELSTYFMNSCLCQI